MSRSIILIVTIGILVSPPARAQPTGSTPSILASTGFADPPFPKNAAWKSSILNGKLKLDEAMAKIAEIVKISIAVSNNANIDINADEEPWNQDWSGNFQSFWARVMSKYKLVDYYSGGTITVTLPAESQGTVYAGVDPELYEKDLIPFLGSAGLFPNDPGNIEAQNRGMRIHFDKGRKVMLVQGPPQFNQQVKTIWTAIAATPPPEPSANFSVMRVHCRHANVEDMEIATGTSDSDTSHLKIRGIFALMKDLLQDPTSVAFGPTPLSSTRGGDDSGGQALRGIGNGQSSLKTILAAREIQQDSGVDTALALASMAPDIPTAERRILLEAISERPAASANAAIDSLMTRPDTRAGVNIASALQRAQAAPKLRAQAVESPERSSQRAAPVPPQSSGAAPQASGGTLKFQETPPQPPDEMKQDNDDVLPRVPRAPLDEATERMFRELTTAGERDAILGDTPLSQSDPPSDARRPAGLNLPEMGRTFEVSGVTGQKGKAVFIADTRTNSILVLAETGMLDFYERVIRALDAPQLLVEISASIVDINADSDFSWNSRFAGTVSGEIQDKTGKLGAGFSAPGLFDPLSSGEVSSQNLLNSNGINVTSALIGESYRIVSQFEALEKVGQARTVSRPSVMTLDNIFATLTDTTRFYVPVNGNEDADLFEIKATTKIHVQPHLVFPSTTLPSGGVSAPVRVRLMINIEDSTLSEDPRKAGQGSANLAQSIPSVVTSRLTTQGEVATGQSLLIGGRYRNEESDSQGRIPILGKIPILGWAFKGKKVTSRRLQRMFLITPRIIEQSDGGDAAQRRAMEMLERNARTTAPRIDASPPAPMRKKQNRKNSGK